MAAKKTQSQGKSKLKVASAKPQPHERRLDGKVAVVTGGSSGIGFAIAQALAAETCNVVITGRDEKKLGAAALRISSATQQNSALIVPKGCDVRDPRAVEEVFATVEAMFGRLDILVNNAGISQPPTPLEQTSLEMWRAQIDTNLTGVFLCTRAAVPLMKRGAIIINNLSAAAKQVFPNFYGYTAAKTGALGFTLSLRAEMMPRGIRVMALLPGSTKTDIWQQIMPNAPFHHMMDTESVAQAVLYAVLLPPSVNPSEISLDPAGGAV
jgi:NAD(P)-dependent dehydrogenase (short-subunit alcohol dehydrogenase family)